MVEIINNNEVQVNINLWGIEDIYHLQNGLISFIQLAIDEQDDKKVSYNDLFYVCEALKQTLLDDQQLLEFNKTQQELEEKEEQIRGLAAEHSERLGYLEGVQQDLKQGLAKRVEELKVENEQLRDNIEYLKDRSRKKLIYKRPAYEEERICVKQELLNEIERLKAENEQLKYDNLSSL